ncbi:MAG: YaaR family protein [Clostridia bacterium]|nr:YaaR family protein [Clostridia bacterium]
MKVKSVKKTQSMTKTKPILKTQPVVPFQEVMAVTEENREKDVLDEMLKDLKQKGQELAKKKEVEILVEYKNMVRSFVEQAVNFGLKISERRGFGRAGRSKIMRMVSMIDEKMIDLTEDMLKQEASGLRLLTKIGEIEGLLLNLYA